MTVAQHQRILLSTVIRCEQKGAFKTCLECGYQDGHDLICQYHESKRAAVSNDLTNVRCLCCQSEHAHNSYDAGFIAGSGMCQVCDAALPARGVPEGKEFSQFLSAVMDAAGLVRHGRQSKELSEYLGSKCMEYMLSATHPADQVAEPDAELVELLRDERAYGPLGVNCQNGVVARCVCRMCRLRRIDAKLASLKGVEE